MSRVDLNRKLSELEQDYASASEVERRQAAPRLREMLQSAEVGNRRWRTTPDPRPAPVDLFDNLPV